MSESSRPLRVFLCHASEDKTAVRELYQRLKTNGVEPWLDEEDLIPGQDWEFQIKRAVRSTDVVLVCLSQRAIDKRGFVQKEVKLALDVADEQPEGAIFVIPVKLEECAIPERLKRWHWVNYFEERGYEQLLRALRERVKSLEQVMTPAPANAQPPAHGGAEQAAKAHAEVPTSVEDISPTRKSLLAQATDIITRIKFEGERADWRDSERGKAEATQEYERFICELERFIAEISERNPDMQFIHEDDRSGFHIFYCLGISLTASWNPGRFANNLTDSGLHLKVLDGRLSMQHFLGEEVPALIRYVRYDIDMRQTLGIVWQESGGDKTLRNTSELAEWWMSMMLHEIERRNRNRNPRF